MMEPSIIIGGLTGIIQGLGTLSELASKEKLDQANIRMLMTNMNMFQSNLETFRSDFETIVSENKNLKFEIAALKKSTNSEDSIPLDEKSKKILTLLSSVSGKEQYEERFLSTSQISNESGESIEVIQVRIDNLESIDFIEDNPDADEPCEYSITVTGRKYLHYNGLID